MADPKTIKRCKDCENARPSLYGSRACSCVLHGPSISFPKMSKACANFKPRKKQNND